jgi:hypothetical protein
MINILADRENGPILNRAVLGRLLNAVGQSVHIAAFRHNP